MIPTPSAFWKMDEVSGNRVDSVSGIALTPSGVQIGSATGLINNAVTFSGGNPAVPGSIASGATTDLAYVNGSDISVSFWINFSGYVGSRYSPEFDYWLTDAGLNYFGGVFVQFVTAGLYVSVVDVATGDDTFLTIPFTPTVGQWYHIAVRYNASTGKVFARIDNGSETEGTDTAFLPSSTHGNLELGITFSLASNPALIDELAFYLDHFLSNSDLSVLFNSGDGETYPFPEPEPEPDPDPEPEPGDLFTSEYVWGIPADQDPDTVLSSSAIACHEALFEIEKTLYAAGLEGTVVWGANYWLHIDQAGSYLSMFHKHDAGICDPQDPTGDLKIIFSNGYTLAAVYTLNPEPEPGPGSPPPGPIAYGTAYATGSAIAYQPGEQYLIPIENACPYTGKGEYVIDGYYSLLQSDAQDFKRKVEKLINKSAVDFNAEPQTTPNDLFFEIAYGQQPSCMMWDRSAPPKELACLTAKSDSEHAADKTRAARIPTYKFFRKGVFLGWRMYIKGTGGCACFNTVTTSVRLSQGNWD